MTVRSLVISMFVAGMAFAQTATQQPAQGTTPGPRGRGGPGPGFGRGGFPGGPGRGIDLFGPKAEERLTRQFALNPTQQNTLHTVIASAKVQQQGMREKETTLRTELGTAVKGGDEGGIERAAAEIETLHQTQTSIHAKSLATIYGSLTPAQQAKFLPMMNRELGIPGPRPAAGAGRGRGPRPTGAQPTTATPQQQ
ncbi:MAG TPA: Spy/CpxP family protein refolding chaperone [Bryobacteraceae bacterium]